MGVSANPIMLLVAVAVVGVAIYFLSQSSSANGSSEPSTGGTAEGASKTSAFVPHLFQDKDNPQPRLVCQEGLTGNYLVENTTYHSGTTPNVPLTPADACTQFAAAKQATAEMMDTLKTLRLNVSLTPVLLGLRRPAGASPADKVSGVLIYGLESNGELLKVNSMKPADNNMFGMIPMDAYEKFLAAYGAHPDYTNPMGICKGCNKDFQMYVGWQYL